MNSPGFEIYNDTIWPMQISLNQVGPLYYELVPPKGYFRRRTGAVWFTIHVSISLDNKLHINDWKCVWPVAAVIGGIALAAVTGGKSAFAAAGTVAAATGGVTMKFASLLVAGGMGATKALVVSGASIAGLTSGAASSALAKIFDNSSAEVAKRGCYSGPPWPFRRRVHTYRITGGPILKDLGNDTAELFHRKLYLD